jgi:CheY-like chemotaxis protein
MKVSLKEVKYEKMRLVRHPKDTLILLVDDDSSLREMVALDLKRYGFQVQEATGGLTLVTRVKEHNPSVPVFLMTGDPDAALDERAKAAEAVFEKPFKQKDLIRAVYKACGLEAAEEEGDLTGVPFF